MSIDPKTGQHYDSAFDLDRRTFTSDRLTWLSAMCADGRISDFTIRVMFVLSGFADSFTGECYPGVAAVAEKAAGSRRGVHGAIKQAVKFKYLRVKVKGGHGRRGKTNSYQILQPLNRCKSRHDTVQVTTPMGADHDKNTVHRRAPDLLKKNSLEENSLDGTTDHRHGGDQLSMLDTTKKGPPTEEGGSKLSAMARKLEQEGTVLPVGQRSANSTASHGTPNLDRIRARVKTLIEESTKTGE